MADQKVPYEIEEEEETEEEEEEPKLKYVRLGNVVEEILQKDTASCLAPHEKFLVIGTHFGVVHVVDFTGTSIKQFNAHTSAVTDISIDTSGDFIASCSTDGSVRIQSVWSQESFHFEYGRPLNSVAIEPGYAKSEKIEFVCGGKDGKLILNTKGWFGFGKKDVVLHQNEGTIYTIRWRGPLIAWANDLGVKIYDTSTKQLITYIDRPKDSLRPDMYLCQLVWENDSTLIIGWGNFVKIAGVRHRPRIETSLPSRYVEILSTFRTPDFYISGIAPFQNELAILGYMEKSPPLNGQKGNQQASEEPPALYTLARNGVELSSDAIPVREFALWKATDYRLAHLATPLSSQQQQYAQQQKIQQANAMGAPVQQNQSFADAAASDWLFYIVSPKDIVTAQTRDIDDHLAWLIQGEHYEKALEEVKKHPGLPRNREHTVAEIGQKYLLNLLQNHDIDLAARECPQVLGNSQELWQRWIVKFEEARKLRTIAPYVPTQNPTLAVMYYEMILNDFLQNDPVGLWTTLNSWPSSLYRLVAIITGIKEKLKLTNSREEQSILCKALTKLYIENKQFDEALDLYSKLGEDVVDFIQKHGLQNFKNIGDQILPIVLNNPEKAIDLFVANTHHIRVDYVVQKLLSYIPNTVPQDASKRPQARPANFDPRNEGRRLAWKYLHALSEKNNRDEGNEFYDLQLELYAEFDSEGFPNLKKFLSKSQAYNYNLALEICRKKELYQEMAVLYDRIGNTQEALNLMIDKVGDVKQAIEFVTKKSEKGESELWDELINRSIHKPLFVSGLLENAGTHINPLQLIEKIPLGLAIPHLRDRLVKIINDYNLQMSLREGCKDVLNTDCVLLSERLTQGLRTAIRVTKGHSFDSEAGKCSMCSMTIFDTKVKAEIIVFFCGHVYHASCLATKAVPEVLDPNARKIAPNPLAGGGESRELTCKICRSSANEEKQSVFDKSLSKSRPLRSQNM